MRKLGDAMTAELWQSTRTCGGRVLRPLGILVVAWLLVSIFLPLFLTGSTSGSTVEVYSVELGPVYHKLPNGKTVEVRAEIIYPSLLIYPESGPYLVPPLRAKIYTNWTAWGANVVVGVMAREYRIDPTTLKPASWDIGRLAAGGCILGPGSGLYARIKPLGAGSSSCVFNLTVSSKLLERLETGREIKGLYFYKVTVSLYDPEKGDVLPGGYVYLYNDPQAAPSTVIKSEKVVLVIDNSVTRIFRKAEGQDVLTSLLVLIALAGFSVGFAALILRNRVNSKR